MVGFGLFWEFYWGLFVCGCFCSRNVFVPVSETHSGEVAGRHKTTVLSKAMKNCPEGRGFVFSRFPGLF